MSRERILIIDNEVNILDLIRSNLEKSGYIVLAASSGEDGLQLAKFELPQLILLDIILPGMDGYDVCKEVRRDNSISKTPIIIISSKDDEVDKILGLELGADDYMTKPLSLRELAARIKAILRRTTLQYKEDLYEFGNLAIDFQKHVVLKDNKKVKLTMKEFELLKILIKNKERVVDREFLLEKVWGSEFDGGIRTVDIHIRYLRKKVEDDDKNPRYIKTVRGGGYRFQ